MGEPSSKAERRRALEVKALKVVCIKCGAAAGEACIANELGEPAAHAHKERLRLASYLPTEGPS